MAYMGFSSCLVYRFVVVSNGLKAPEGSIFLVFWVPGG